MLKNNKSRKRRLFFMIIIGLGVFGLVAGAAHAMRTFQLNSATTFPVDI